jgi:hypothetical protein
MTKTNCRDDKNKLLRSLRLRGGNRSAETPTAAVFAAAVESNQTPIPEGYPINKFEPEFVILLPPGRESSSSDGARLRRRYLFFSVRKATRRTPRVRELFRTKRDSAESGNF